jgi:hypothetical protein
LLIDRAALGVVAGAPDFIFVSETSSIFIELKISSGSLSKSQKKFKNWCDSCGVVYYVCYSIMDVFSVLQKHSMLSSDVVIL